jgi:hyperosmotically inducible protein
MELKRRHFFTAAALAAVLTAGCSQSMKSDDTAQKSDQAAQLPAPSQVNNTSGPTMTAIDDATITTKVKAAIIAEPTLSVLDIKVNTVDGIVTLTGSVDDPAKVSRAQQLVQAIDGVKGVNYELADKHQS